jgi:hypothetical protein
VERDGEVLKDVLKLKGIRMTDAVTRAVQPHVLADLARGDADPLLLEQHLIRKSLFRGKLHSHQTLKTLRFTSTKRHIRDDTHMLETLPYGY